MTPAGKAERTRARILEAATELFAARSFESVTIRRIAGAAHVDPALVHHYFGSKEQLFDAVLETATPLGALDGLLEDDDPSRWGEELVRSAERIWAAPVGRGMVAVVRRAIAGRPDVLRAFVTRTILAHVVGRLPGDDDERALRASLVGSQMAGLLLARHVVAIEPLAGLPAHDVARLVGPTIQHYLTGDLEHAGPEDNST
mgnify:CR=1 FL=1